jgi:PEP-CTERM motif
MHLQYFSQAPGIAPGSLAIANFNIFGGNEGLSDTLSIVFTGLAPSVGTLDNVRVDLQFASESENGAIQALPDPGPLGHLFEIDEGAGPLQLDQGVLFQDVSPLLQAVLDPAYPADFHVRYSSIPEPSTLALLGIGLAGLASSRRKRKQ